MFNKAIILTLANILGRFINFMLFLVIANKFGANKDTDWFFLNYGVVYFFTGILFNASENILVPIWNNNKKIHHNYIFQKFIGYSWYIFLFTAAIIFIVGTIISPMIGVGHPTSNISMILLISSIFSVQPVLAFMSSIFSSYMQYERKYILPTVHLALRSLGVLPIIILNHCTTILCLSFSFLIGETLRFFVMQKNYFKKLQLKGKKTHKIELMSDVIRKIALMSLTLSLTLANPLVDLIMISHLNDGNVSLVEYANRLRGLPILGFNGILILLLGEWAKHHSRSIKGLTLRNILKLLFPAILVSSFIVFLLFISFDHWIKLIFFSNKFSTYEISVLKNLIAMYFIGIPMLIGVFILTRAIIVYQQYQAYAIITVLMFLTNIIFNVILINSFGLKGVAMSTSLVDFISLVLLFFLTKKISTNTTTKI
jgi:putative peptidoglycan lipid II flippase